MANSRVFFFLLVTLNFVTIFAEEDEIEISTTTEVPTTIRANYTTEDTVRIVDEGNEDDDSGRILGGASVTTGGAPYVVNVEVTLNDGTIINCGGAIISPTYVATAAQCLVQAASIRVIGGSLSAAPGTVVRGQPIIHPQFTRRNLFYDFGLVNLLDPIYNTPSATIGPINIPRYEQTHAASQRGASVMIMGWGSQDNTQTFAGVGLQHLTTTVVTLDDCNSALVPQVITYPSTHYCLNTVFGTKGFCFGDKGGPVIYIHTDNLHYLVGIMSDFVACPTRFPNAYMRTKFVLSYIRLNVPDLP